MPEDKPLTFKSHNELPPMAASLGRMSVMATGSWRNAEPFYIDHTPPCTFKCPAGNDIAGFLRLTAEGKYSEAWELILRTSPFPGICGRVCPHPCESECNRNELGGKVNIHSIERFLADKCVDIQLPKAEIKYPDKKIAVIGSGPAGLSAAFHLTQAGYPVTVFESYPKAGGMMRVGIPDYRLPREALDREIAAIVSSGTEIKTGVKIGKDVDLQILRKEYPAIFIAVGNHSSRSLGIKNEDHPDIISGVEMLRRIAFGENPGIKGKVVVIGGGNTAMDTARSASRLGAEVKVLYRRTRSEMPAIEEEIDECLAEGIPIEFLTAPVGIHTKNGRITGVRCNRMKLGDPDSSGRRRPVPVEGSEFTIPTAQIISAIGESPDISFVAKDLKVEKWGIPADEFGITNVSGVFAGGDSSTGEGTVTHAIGSGRRAAIAIQKFLKGESLSSSDKIPPSLINVSPQIVRFENLNTAYFDYQFRIEADFKPIHDRRGNFSEIVSSFDEELALREAQRCLSCGSCVGCDNCYVFCPDAAVSHGDEPGKYIIDLKHCKGCGLCAEECPRFCMELKPVR